MIDCSVTPATSRRRSRRAPPGHGCRVPGAVGILVAAVLTSCGREGLEPLAFATLARGSSPVSREVTSQTLAYLVITDATAWSESQRRGFSASLPELHFADEFALRVEWGPCPTGGYGIEVDEVGFARRSHTLHVGLQLQKPRPDDMVIQALTTPFAVVRIPLPHGIQEAGALAVQFSRLDGGKREKLEARRLAPTASH